MEPENFVITLITSKLFLPSNLGRPIPCPEPVKLQIYSVGFTEYEKHCYDLSQLRETCEYERFVPSRLLKFKLGSTLKWH